MELKISSPKAAGLSPSDFSSDPEEKEFSDDDDDDRNHKHRRRDTGSQSLERDAMGQAFSRPFRKRNKPFGNGYPIRESDSQSSEGWKNYANGPLEKDFSSKFERRRPGLSTFTRAPLDLNQRIRVNQSFSGDSGPGRGRGRDYWNQRDSRFSSVDAAAQVVHQGSIPPSLFAGRGLPNVSNAQSASWSAFGLMPGVPNGGLDTIHSLGFQGSLRPPKNPSSNMGIPRQRCRDFEERGFCLRGDMCPMEHGINRIVVEDVQSLSQFNLPVSLPSAHLLGTPAGPGSILSVPAPSSSLMNNKGFHGKSSNLGMVDHELGLNGAFTDSADAGGADLYDPDQPLWNNDSSKTLLALNSSKIDEPDSLLHGDPSERINTGFCDSADFEHPGKTTATAIGSQSSSLSIWGRIGNSKSRSEVKEKTKSTLKSPHQLVDDTKGDRGALVNVQGNARQGKRIIKEDSVQKAMDSSNKIQNDTVHNSRKSSQKAQRTLFVNGIPQKNNKRESLLSHFQKFGEVIDIYIPLNSERAFVQFSKREEAEAALKAPDAVMGNRFIKLWWANRDSIPDDGMSSGNNVAVAPCGNTAASIPSHLPVANRGKDNVQSAAPKVSNASASDVPVPAGEHPKPVITNGPKAPPPQKKLESLELLKEELRRKREMLDQKRNDFRRQLDKLEKQASGLKGESATEQGAKRQKVEITADVGKAVTPRPSDPGTTVASARADMITDNNRSVEKFAPHSSNTTSAMVLQEPSSLKQPIRPLAPVVTPFGMNRFKLDNRPMAFRIVPPLPTGLANVCTLEEHFSSLGDLSSVEIEDLDTHDSGNSSATSKNCSACIYFTTRRSAERAFMNGQCWQGHNLQFTWLTSTGSNNDGSGKENSVSSPKGSIDANVQPGENLPCNVSQEATLSENGKSENSEKNISGDNDIEPASEKNMSGDDDIEPAKEIQSCSTQMLSEKESPTDDVS